MPRGNRAATRSKGTERAAGQDPDRPHEAHVGAT